MARPVVPAASSALTEEDLRKRDIVQELVKSENKSITDFAKHLVTASFSAIAVILALKDKWFGADPTLQQKLLLGTAIGLFLLAGLAGSLAAGVYIHRVSLDDYGDVDAELRRVAKRRYRLTRLSFGLSFLATILVAVVVI